MTNAEAIKVLERIRQWTDYSKEALTMAIEALSKPSLPSNLDEAAKKEVEHFCSDIVNIDSVWANMPLTKKFGLQMFKAGAEWMAGQGFSFEDEVYYDGTTPFVNDADFDIIELKDSVKNGDKVIVQIRKK